METDLSRSIGAGPSQVVANASDGPPIRVLHLSDLHFSAKTAWDSGTVLDRLAADVENLSREVGKIDLVVVTGDIANFGTSAEYEQAAAWLTGPLATAAGVKTAQIRVVPGNHDVHRGSITRTAKALTNDLLSDPDPQQAIAEVLSSETDRAPLLARQSAYLTFAQTFHPGLTVPWWFERPVIRGLTVHLAGFNSAWLSASDADRATGLLLSRWQCNQLLNGADTADLTIALLHHPWDYLSERDQESEEEIRRRCGVILNGHLHQQKARLAGDPDRDVLQLAAGASYAGSKWANAYQLLELDPHQGVAKVHFRAWDGHDWIPDRNRYPKNARDGVANLRLRRSPRASQQAYSAPRKRGPFPSIPSRRWRVEKSGANAETDITTDKLVDHRALILLGEPGAGKSYELMQLHGWEPQGGGDAPPVIYLRQVKTPRDLEALVKERLSNVNRSGSLWLYFDGLDEARGDQGALVEALESQLGGLQREPCGLPQLRLTCRSACWTEEMEAAFRRLYGSSLHVVSLLPLSQHEAEQLAKHWLRSRRTQDDMLTGAELVEALYRNGAADLAAKPITLRMVSRLRNPMRRINSRVELFKEGLTELAKEWEDPIGEPPANRRRLSDDTTLRYAIWLAALAMFSKEREDWHGDVPENAQLRQLENALNASEEDLRPVICSALFVSDPGQFSITDRVFAHKSYMEFLAALCLVEEAQLDVWRELLLLKNGRVSERLRSVAAWLCVLDVSFREHAMKADPLLLLNPDTHHLSAADRARLFDRLMGEVMAGEQAFMSRLIGSETHLSLIGAEDRLAQWLAPERVLLTGSSNVFIYALRCAQRTLLALDAPDAPSDGAEVLLNALVKLAMASESEQQGHVLQALLEGLGRSPGDPKCVERTRKRAWWIKQLRPLQAEFGRLSRDVQICDDESRQKHSSLIALAWLLWPGIRHLEDALRSLSLSWCFPNDLCYAWLTKMLPALAQDDRDLGNLLLVKWADWLGDAEYFRWHHENYDEALDSLYRSIDRYLDHHETYERFVSVVFLTTQRSLGCHPDLSIQHKRQRLLEALMSRAEKESNGQYLSEMYHPLYHWNIIYSEDRSWWLDQVKSGGIRRQELAQRALAKMPGHDDPAAFAEVREAYQSWPEPVQKRFDALHGRWLMELPDPRQVNEDPFLINLNAEKQRALEECRHRLSSLSTTCSTSEERWRKVTASLFGWVSGTADSLALQISSLPGNLSWKSLEQHERAVVIEAAIAYLEYSAHSEEGGPITSTEELLRVLEGELSWPDCFAVSALHLLDPHTQSHPGSFMGLSRAAFHRWGVLMLCHMDPKRDSLMLTVSERAIKEMQEARPYWDWSTALRQDLSAAQIQKIEHLLSRSIPPGGLVDDLVVALRRGAALAPALIERVLPLLVRHSGRPSEVACQYAEDVLNGSVETSDERVRRGAVRALLNASDRDPDVWRAMLQWLGEPENRGELNSLGVLHFTPSELSDLYRLLRRVYGNVGDPHGRAAEFWTVHIGLDWLGEGLYEQESLRVMEDLHAAYPDDQVLSDRLKSRLKRMEEREHPRKPVLTLLRLGRNLY